MKEFCEKYNIWEWLKLCTILVFIIICGIMLYSCYGLIKQNEPPIYAVKKTWVEQGSVSPFLMENEICNLWLVKEGYIDESTKTTYNSYTIHKFVKCNPISIENK